MILVLPIGVLRALRTIFDEVEGPAEAGTNNL